MSTDRERDICPGSGQPLIDPGYMFGTCAVCGKQSVCHDEGSDIAWRHRALSAPKEDR